MYRAGNDITSPVAINEMKKMNEQSVFDKEKIALVMDHFIPNKDIKSAENCKLLREIIAEKGSDGFLKIEDEINSKVNVKKTVVSPGGSVVYCENAMRHYKEIGKVLYLKVSYETISRRLKNAKKRGVVLRDGQSLEDLYNERVRLFEKYADITVCEDGCSLEDTIGQVLEALEAYAEA